MDEMRAEYESVKLIPKVTMREMFSNPQLRIPLFIAMTVMVAQQLSGINAVRTSLNCHNTRETGHYFLKGWTCKFKVLGFIRFAKI